MAQAKTVQSEILRHLGGSRFAAMTGAKNLLSLADGLQFDLQRAAKNGVNRLQIELDNKSDSYTVKAWKVSARKLTADLRYTCELIQAEALPSIFTTCTGLATHL